MCIDDVGPAAYAEAFRAMYGAHYEESACTLAQTAMKTVEDALKLLRVASQLGFSTGVDAALLRIQAVPWTTSQEASVAQCINLLQVPVSQELDARLKTDHDMQSIHLNRKAVRSALVEDRKRRLPEWRNALGSFLACRHSSSLQYRDGSSVTFRAVDVFLQAVGNICNSMFGLFCNAASLGVGNALILCLVEDENFQQVLTNSSVEEHTNSGAASVISHDALLLVLLRIVQALSEGEVVCHEELRMNMVCKCLTEYTSPSIAIQQHLSPSHDGMRLRLSEIREYSHALHQDLDTYMKAYELRKSQIKLDLATRMGQVSSTLKRQISVADLLHCLTSVDRTDEYLDKILTTLIARLQVRPEP